MNKATEADRQAVRIMVRAREDFQAMRKRMDNRIARKADGTDQNHENMAERVMDERDRSTFEGVADAAHKQEADIEKALKKVLKRFPVYNEFLAKTKGVGPIAAGWIISEYDIERATTVSKLWQFTGLNPSMVPGKKRIENKDGTFSLVPTGDMVRGDKLTAGHVAPFNKRLRTAMVGVLADGFIKAQNDYCMRYYYPYKARLEQEDSMVSEVSKAGAKPKDIPWKDAKKGHRDRAAKRYMIKMFLRDLYVAWRTIEGLPVREPYAAEYLGKSHAA